MLKVLSCLDSDQIAAQRQKILSIPRDFAEKLGRSAVEAASNGVYTSSSGNKVNWNHTVLNACSAKLSIPPGFILPSRVSKGFSETLVRVMNETTLRAAQQMVDGGLRPLALNFANGVNPGGGFLHGALAQEEVLCRSSALYLTLVGDPMYTSHRKRSRPDSTEWSILSPDVPVFRTDDGIPLESPWLLSFITCAAPYAPAIGQPESGDLLNRRIHRVLDIARAYEYDALILGAWGCGAFGNDAKRTAEDFRHALEGEFNGCFSNVIFAITDWSPGRKFLGPFRDVFS